MAKRKEKEPVCDRCGLSRALHVLVNFADGQFVGQSFLICQTAVFYPKVKKAGVK